MGDAHIGIVTHRTPIDVFATVIRAVGTAYPGAEILTRPGDAGVTPGRDETVLRIPAGDRPAPEVEVEPDPADDDVVAFGIDEGGFRFGSTREELTVHIAALAEAIFATWTDAENYLETEVTSKDTGQRYTLTFGRVSGLTPHQARRAAEEQRDQLLAHIRGECGCTSRETCDACIDAGLLDEDT